MLEKAFMTGVGAAELAAKYPILPQTWPNLPKVGLFFGSYAEAMAEFYVSSEACLAGVPEHIVKERALRVAYTRALYDPQFTFYGTEKGLQVTLPTVSGHLLGSLEYGPRRADVMVLGKNPGQEEVLQRRNFVGPSSEVFFEAMHLLGYPEEKLAKWYSANLVKWPPTSERSSSLAKSHVTDCLPLLHMEIALCRPRVILCMGSDASKALLGSGFGVSAMVGRVEPYRQFVVGADGAPEELTIPVVAVTHPASVYRNPEQMQEFMDQLQFCLQVIEQGGEYVAPVLPPYEEIYTASRLRQIVDEIRSDPDPWRRVIAVDAEWHGSYPTDDNAYLRTVQFSSKEGEGYVVVLRQQAGEAAFVPSISEGVQELRRLLCPDPAAGWFPRVGGQLFRADLPWLVHAGVDCRASYAPAATWQEQRHRGGWDTGLMVHSVQETVSFALTDLAIRLTPLPRYDQGVDLWKVRYCKEHDLKASELEGYGMCPDWVLHPYAGADADATRRIAIRAMQPGGLLDADAFGNSCWEPFWRAHVASLGLLEMEMTGLLVDRDRVDELASTYADIRQRMLTEFRRQICWDKFNPDSSPHCVAFLFGDQYGYRVTKGERVPTAPAEAIKLNLRPIKSTGKRPRVWDWVVQRGLEARYVPSTDKEVLGIIGHSHPLAMMLRDIKFIGQLLKGLVRAPRRDEQAEAYVVGDDGYYEYDAGITERMCDDGRVHTHLSQLMETGRGASSRPNLMAISSKREGDYARIAGYVSEGVLKGDYVSLWGGTPRYRHPVKSVFRAPPGYVLLGSDFKGAELSGLAWLSQDPVMIEHTRRNCLSETHPEYMDIHSTMAVTAFRLECEPTKKGLKSIGKQDIRTAAKNIIFGIPYGRQAPAIVRQCREEGTYVTEEEVDAIIASYFCQYAMVGPFLEECQRRSQVERWLAGSFGRFRRFAATNDRSVVGEQQRQAQNFPIQNLVADALWQAISNFMQYHEEHPEVDFRLVLPIHDALLFQVRIDHLEFFLREVLEDCMVRRVPIYPRYLDNRPIPNVGPYFFGIDSSIYLNWGESIKPEHGASLGIPDTVFSLLE